MNPAERLFLERYVSNPGRNLFRFSFVFMVLGIVLSVGILTAALNLFEGYERALRSVLLDSFPHIRAQSNTRTYLSDAETNSAVNILQSQPEIASVTPNLAFSLMAFNGSKVRGSMMNAYDYKPGSKLPYKKYIIKGKPELQEGNIIVGYYLARELGLALHDTLHVVYPQLDRITPLGMYPNESSFIISGIYRSGYYEYDRTLILGTVQDARSILRNTAGFNSLEIKLKNAHIDDSAKLSARYDYLLGDQISTLPVANTSLLRIVRMQKWLIFIIFSFLVLIAGINVISCVGALIFDKKNEIAVMKALGAGAGIIRNILGYQMLVVCLASIITGQLFGLLLSWLVVVQNFYHLKGEVYFIDRLELYVSPLNQAVTFAVAATLVYFCIRIPLRRIDRMLVIDLLRNP